MSSARLLGSAVALFALFAAANACTNDYDPYAFGPTTSAATAGAPHGFAGEPASSAGTGSGAEPSGTGGSSAGAPDTSPNPPQSCGDDEAYCGDDCAPVDTTEQCGGCDNDCSTQGDGDGFTCVGLRCGCSDVEQCGMGATRCAILTGACVCDGVTCRRGETCGGPRGNIQCSCNGEDGCATGETCCASPAGCFDLSSDTDHCGGCGRQCAQGESCLNGQCRAR